jgi:hypothetical protein
MIYGWQNYLIWKIFVSKSFKSLKLINFGKEVIRKDENIADMCGAILYLGSCGDQADKKIILQNFTRFNNFLLQRHALIALQELKWKEIKDKIENKVSEESLGIYRELRTYSNPFYLELPREVPISELIREISFYA